ncbi:MAG: site-specific DNA-methyltransferase [Sinimarinibacterium flocculans]|uniref:site-specific DNA-methyltransferase n=1 Tax=Sinimarinibacterium flocculans TaxID=985250 RepID=UPI003C50FEB6
MPFLDWVNKNQAKEATRAVPVHLLKQEAVYGGSDDSPPENLLIQGDNLLALKALIPVYAGRIKCIYIDPPYNTQSAFEHYDDKLEHSQWLSMMYPRLVMLKELLSDDGCLWISIDDKEMAYLRVVCDEVFGRKNFLNAIVVKTSDPSGHKTVNPSPYSQTEYVLLYAKTRSLYKYVQRYVESGYDTGYNQYLVNRASPIEEWQVVGLNEYVAQKLGHENTRDARRVMGRFNFDSQVAQFALENADSVFQATAISSDAGKDIVDARERSKRNRERVYVVEREDYEDIYIRNGRQIYFYASKLRLIDGVMVPTKPLTNLWTDIPWNGISGEGAVEFKNGKKPERLVERCIELCTSPGDFVLDSFLGSGTTAAVAHKMGRRYIGIEMGEHARTHCVPRLQKVIDGEQSGISEAVGWKGGGGFRFCTLGQAAFDADGRINPDVRFGTLAAFVWHYETATPAAKTFNKPLLGRHNGTAYYLLYNGILGDKRPQGGNVLTHAVLQMLKEKYPHDGPKVVYGETTRLGDAKLAAEGVTFKQIPYDIKTR